MELDDFRGQWQAQTADKNAPFTDAQMQLLLTKRPGLIEKMCASVRLEAWTTAGLMVPVGWLSFTYDDARFLVVGIVLLLICLGQLYYYYRKLGLLRRMARVEGHVRKHLEKLTAQVRQMIKGYYWASIIAWPFGLLLSFGGVFGYEMGSPGPLRANYLLTVAGVMTLVAMIGFFPFRAAIRWYLQRLYGQHLDQLEGALHELRD